MTRLLRTRSWIAGVLLALLLALPLAGCGQKGPLYQPQPPAPADHPKDAP